MNYLIAWCLCVAGSVMTALAGGEHLQWLFVSDVNVTIWLTVAWLLERRRAVHVLVLK